MSAADAQDAAKNKEFVDMFTKEVEVALRGLAEKYKGQINDMALIVNWTPENHQKPYPKLVVETLRDVNAPDYDPIRQSLELSDLLSMGGTHITRQLLFQFMKENHEMQAALEQAQPQNPGKPDLKIIVPGQ